MNRLRQKDRPLEPNSLDFELADDYIPKQFLQVDIMLDDARHLVFATSEQLSLLKKARTWYMDATFRVVRKPFQQHFGIHAFVKGQEGNIKQVRTTSIYTHVTKTKERLQKSSKRYHETTSGV